MTSALFLGALRHDRATVLASLAVVVVLAWAWLLSGAGLDGAAMDMGGMMVMAPGWTPGYAALLFVMWVVMMVAMMLPSAAPVTLLVARLAGKRAAGARAHALTALFVLGYLAVWVAFAGAATALHWALGRAGLLSGEMALGNRMLAAALLIAAGFYQTTPLKAACLRHCRSPLGFLMLHWRDGALGAVSSGLRHGVFCLGCCWMLMALLFVGGVMSVLWIGGIALLVLIEKTLPWGRHVGFVAGVALVVWGMVALATAL